MLILFGGLTLIETENKGDQKMADASKECIRASGKTAVEAERPGPTLVHAYSIFLALFQVT